MLLAGRALLLLSVCVVLSVVGCRHRDKKPAASPEAIAAVRLMKGDPPPECREVGDVSATASEDDVKRELKEEAAKVGANYVRMEKQEFATWGRYTLSGTAFACPTAP